METAILILNILILLGLGVVTLFVKSFFPFYIGEKGKNLATKEDISVITEKIESVKSEYARELERAKSHFQIESSLKQAFQSQSLKALEAINQLLVDITKYCWREIANRSGNEHYVWDSVDDSLEHWNFHYFAVAIDKAILENSLYLTGSAETQLKELSSQIGLLSGMELSLMSSNPLPEVVNTASGGYSLALEAVEKCRMALMSELGLASENERIEC